MGEEQDRRAGDCPEASGLLTHFILNSVKFGGNNASWDRADLLDLLDTSRRVCYGRAGLRERILNCLQSLRRSCLNSKR